MRRMRFISHRGNISGPIPLLENSIGYIDEAITLGYDVEIDARFIKGAIYLGHDSPETEIELSFLLDRSSFLWIHCKDILTLAELTRTARLNCFFHDSDDATLTSMGFIWTYPSKQLTKNSVCVLPEKSSYTEDDLKMCFGICSDNIEKYKRIINDQL